jgi:hypothetical protein
MMTLSRRRRADENGSPWKATAFRFVVRRLQGDYPVGD